jgi:hypothetical protein
MNVKASKTEYINVDVHPHDIMKAAVDIILSKAGLTDEHFIDSDSGNLCQEDDFGRHGSITKIIGPATDLQKEALKLCRDLNSFVRRNP